MAPLPSLLRACLLASHVLLVFAVRDLREAARQEADAAADAARLCAPPMVGRHWSFEAACHAVCESAVRQAKQPIYPAYFFGGLSEVARTAIENSSDSGSDLKDKLAACSDGSKGPCLHVSTVVRTGKEQYVVLDAKRARGSGRELFVFPLSTPAYFTCYTRDKTPMFTTWTVDAAYTADGSADREGIWTVMDPEDARYKPYYASYHSKLPDEYLRDQDVSGVWQEYFGLDRGHWAPDADFRLDPVAVASTYFFVNAGAQSACLNRGQWFSLEDGIRKTARALAEPVEVIAGPLRKLPVAQFEDGMQDAQRASWRRAWTNLLDAWRMAGEWLMQGRAGKKPPHWIEATWCEGCADANIGRQCMLRASQASAERDERFPDFKDLASCSPERLVERDVLEQLSLFMMTEEGMATGGRTRPRRGIFVPMAFFKTVKLPSNGGYCCWIMDQTNRVAGIRGPACLQAVKSHSFSNYGGVFAGYPKYAGDALCDGVFAASGEQGTTSGACRFGELGIGWRGMLLFEEMAARYPEADRVAEGFGGGPKEPRPPQERPAARGSPPSPARGAAARAPPPIGGGGAGPTSLGPLAQAAVRARPAAKRRRRRASDDEWRYEGTDGESDDELLDAVKEKAPSKRRQRPQRAQLPTRTQGGSDGMTDDPAWRLSDEEPDAEDDHWLSMGDFDDDLGELAAELAATKVGAKRRKLTPTTTAEPEVARSPLERLFWFWR